MYTVPRWLHFMLQIVQKMVFMSVHVGDSVQGIAKTFISFCGHPIEKNGNFRLIFAMEKMLIQVWFSWRH